MSRATDLSESLSFTRITRGGAAGRRLNDRRTSLSISENWFSWCCLSRASIPFRFHWSGKFSKTNSVEKISLVMEFSEGWGRSPHIAEGDVAQRRREATYSALAGPGRSPGFFFGFWNSLAKGKMKSWDGFLLHKGEGDRVFKNFSTRKSERWQKYILSQ